MTTINVKNKHSLPQGMPNKLKILIIFQPSKKDMTLEENVQILHTEKFKWQLRETGKSR